MAAGDRLIHPVSPTTGAPYATYEVTDETGDASGYKQAAQLVKVVGDDGSTSGLATSAKQDTGNTSLASIDTKLSGTGSVKDNGPGWTSVWGLGSPAARFTSADQSGAAASVTAAPTNGQRLVVTDLIISVDTAMRVDFKEETSGTVLLSVYMAANSTLQVTPRGKLKLTTADKKLQVQTSAAGNISILPFYYSEA